MKIAARSRIWVRPGPALAGLSPAFQTDPSAPAGSVRVIRLPSGVVELQNYHSRPVSVCLLFLQQDTVESLALLAQAIPKKGPS